MIIGGIVALGGAVGGYFWWKDRKKNEQDKKDQEAAQAQAASGPSPASISEASLCLKPSGTAEGVCSAIGNEFYPKVDGAIAKVAFVCTSSGVGCTAVPASGQFDVQPGQVLCASTNTVCGPPL